MESLLVAISVLVLVMINGLLVIRVMSLLNKLEEHKQQLITERRHNRIVEEQLQASRVREQKQTDNYFALRNQVEKVIGKSKGG